MPKDYVDPPPSLKRAAMLDLALAALLKLGRPAKLNEITELVVRSQGWDAAHTVIIRNRLYPALRNGKLGGALKQVDGALWQIGTPGADPGARSVRFKTGEALRLTIESLEEFGRPALAAEIAERVAEKKQFDRDKLFLIRNAVNDVLRRAIAPQLIIVHSRTAAGAPLWTPGPTTAVPARKLRFQQGQAKATVIEALRKIGRPAGIKEIARAIPGTRRMDKAEGAAFRQSLYGAIGRAVKDRALEPAPRAADGLRWRLSQAESERSCRKRKQVTTGARGAARSLLLS